MIGSFDAPQDQLGNYRLMRLLGRGGSATVYLGEHLYLKRLAAIKVLRAVLSPHERAWFLDEAKLLATLSHPQIVRVLEFAVTPRFVIVQDNLVAENVPFLTMDFVPGGNLRAFCPAGSALSLDVVVRSIKQIASSLQYAHDRGIIHRDIKPENLLLNERQEIMLSDFGLAVFAPSPNVLSLQEMTGTIPYAAPEQLRGEPVFASDQYSLGIIAYEWLCGHRPFEGENAQIILQHISSPPPPLRKEKPSLPVAVEDVILRALAKDPQQRFSGVQAFAQALEDASQRRPFHFTHRLRALDKELPPVAQLQQYPFSEIEVVERREASTVSMRKNRQRMLRKVRSFWITGVLELSLRQVSLITPQLCEAHDAVANPWSLSLYQSEKHVRSFASGTSISEVYDQAQGGLLILGEAGSGKTTLLLELARHLLDRAEQDETHPIPVILTLSSWAEKQLPIDRWLIEELNSKYQVPVALGAQWVHDDMLLPLLDGLDEVAATVRSACVAAINAYQQIYGPSPLVICSRLTEYLLYPPRVFLQSAVIVQPLTMEQIERFLLDAGPELEGVSQALRHDRALQQLVTTPLMFNIIVFTYRGKSLQEVLAMRASQQRHQQILSRYVEQMLRRHATSAYSPEQVRIWLSYLARHMKQHNQTIFYLDRLQPDWIEDHRARHLYAWLAVWLPGALIGALIGTLSIDFVFFIGGGISFPFFEALPGLVMGYLLCRRGSTNVGLISPPMETSPDEARSVKRPRQFSEHVITGLSIALMVWLCFLLTFAMDHGNFLLNRHLLFVALGLEQGVSFGFINGLIMGGASILMSLFLQRSMKPKPERNNGSQSTSLLEHLRNGLFLGLVTELSIGLTLLPSSQNLTYVIIFYLGYGCTFGLGAGLFGVLISFLLADHDGRIRFSDIVSWSWLRLRESLCNWHRMTTGLLIGLIVMAVDVLNAVLQMHALNAVLPMHASKAAFWANWWALMVVNIAFTGIFVAGGYCFIRAVQAAISRRDVDARSRIHSNEGAWRSLCYGLMGSGVGALVALIAYISMCLLYFVLIKESGSFPHHLFACITQGLALGWGFSLHGVLLIVVMAGLLTFLLLGGLACFQHVILRLCLWRTGSLPLSASRFLDYVTHCTLFQRVGSGYLFTHRLLFEYFLSLDDEQK